MFMERVVPWLTDAALGNEDIGETRAAACRACTGGCWRSGSAAG